MTYRPAETLFGPPLRVRVPAILYLFVAIAALALVLVAEASPPTSILFALLLSNEEHRFISARTFAIALIVSAIAALVRSGMRGVRVRGDGLEYRDLVSHVWPKIRRFRWAEIDGVVLDMPGEIAIDLWDGSRVFLPKVWDREGLAGMLERVAAARAIPVRGGRGIDDIPDSGEFADEA